MDKRDNPLHFMVIHLNYYLQPFIVLTICLVSELFQKHSSKEYLQTQKEYV